VDEVIADDVFSAHGAPGVVGRHEALAARDVEGPALHESLDDRRRKRVASEVVLVDEQAVDEPEPEEDPRHIAAEPRGWWVHPRSRPVPHAVWSTRVRDTGTPARRRASGNVTGSQHTGEERSASGRTRRHHSPRSGRLRRALAPWGLIARFRQKHGPLPPLRRREPSVYYGSHQLWNPRRAVMDPASVRARLGGFPATLGRGGRCLSKVTHHPIAGDTP